jgi:hypothetical protein
VKKGLMREKGTPRGDGVTLTIGQEEKNFVRIATFLEDLMHSVNDKLMEI